MIKDKINEINIILHNLNRIIILISSLLAIILGDIQKMIMLLLFINVYNLFINNNDEN